jgi:hypothetical protein
VAVKLVVAVPPGRPSLAANTSDFFSLSTTYLVFKAQAWNEPQSVVVTLPSDNIAREDSSFYVKVCVHPTLDLFFLFSSSSPFFSHSLAHLIPIHRRMIHPAYL